MNEISTEVPCKDCICFPICRSKIISKPLQDIPGEIYDIVVNCILLYLWVNNTQLLNSHISYSKVYIFARSKLAKKIWQIQK